MREHLHLPRGVQPEDLDPFLLNLDQAVDSLEDRGVIRQRLTLRGQPDHLAVLDQNVRGLQHSPGGLGELLQVRQDELLGLLQAVPVGPRDGPLDSGVGVRGVGVPQLLGDAPVRPLAGPQLERPRIPLQRLGLVGERASSLLGGHGPYDPSGVASSEVGRPWAVWLIHVTQYRVTRWPSSSRSVTR
jgi:hypothetical protein